ncbi:MAG: hypothetical protein U0174_27860 [Polyangiaceae bacterium]
MSTRRSFASVLLLAVIASPVIVNCAAAGAMGGMVPGAGKCPDLTSPEAALNFDYAKEFGLKADGAAKLKGGVSAALEITDFTKKVDADLLPACGNIVADLTGTKTEFKSGQEACEAAAKAIADVKGKLGGTVKVALAIKPPECRADMNVMADCAAKCDASVTPGSAKVECEPGKLAGTCDAKCEGTCDMQVAATCTAECSGTCDAEIKGTCSGKCDGKCDGKASKGASCAGTCEGKCDAQVKGTCKGKCGGNCDMKAGGECKGTCSGKCSVEMKAPKCSGEVKPPKMSAECKASCDTKVSAKAECTPAQVGVTITGNGDAALIGKLKGTLEKNLPLVLKVAIGMKDNAMRISGNGKAVVDGVQASIQEIAGQAGAKAAMVGGQLTACLGGTFKGAADAAASLKGSVDVSVKVSASASASGSAGGGGSAGTK